MISQLTLAVNGSPTVTCCRKLPSPVPYNPDDCDVLHRVQGQRICDKGIQGNQTSGGCAYRQADDRHDQGDKDEVVVVVHRGRLAGLGVLPEVFSYIYIGMCDRRSIGNQLV